MGIASDFTALEPRLPPAPRKLPRQSRSRMAVASIREACVKILRQQGPQQLKARVIEEVSGVAMGSIYQYFPTIDAIIVAVYEEVMQNQIELMRAKANAEWREMSLEDAIENLIRDTLALHRRLLELDRECQRSFYHSFDLGSWFNRVAGDPQASMSAFRGILESHRCQHPGANVEMEALILSAVLRSAIVGAVRYDEAQLDAPEFVDDLLHLCLGVIGRSPERRTRPPEVHLVSG